MGRGTANICVAYSEVRDVIDWTVICKGIYKVLTLNDILPWWVIVDKEEV